MPIIQGQTNIAGGATVENLLAGSPFEFLPFNAMVEIALTTDSAATIGDLEADVLSGADLLAQGFKLPNNDTINVERDTYLEDMALAGDRLSIRVRNTTAATARNANFLVRITPL